MNRFTVTSKVLALTLAVAATSCGFGKKKEDKEKDLPPPAAGYMVDTGFRPNKHGFAFENSGGNFPRTPGIVDTNTVVKMFGKDACVGGATQKCKLTPPAAEWAAMVNRAMNGGRCEGMAVAALTMFQQIDKPSTYGKGATSARNVNQQAVTPLIGYYWAWQTVNPTLRDRNNELRNTTPAQSLDKLVTMLKAKQLATIAIFTSGPPRSGHAVTPYAVEHKGNDVYWVRVYDNNWPDKERYIVIDKKANTWRYDVAATNPDVPKRPWSGNASTRSLAVVPLASRLKKAECPFCKSAGKKTVIPRGASVTISDSQGRKLGYDADNKLVNDIPDADVVDLASFVDGAESPEPIYILPDDQDYDLSIGSTNAKPDDDTEDDDDATSVAIFSGGSALSIGRNKRGAGERDTLSLSKGSDDIRYKTGSGKVPRLRLAMDDDGEGTVVGIRNLKADKDDEVDLKVDRKEGRVRLQGGGKKTDSYDLKVRRVRADSDDEEVEAKGVKLGQGESHDIEVRPKKGQKLAVGGKGIKRGKAVPRPKTKGRDVKDSKDSKDVKDVKDSKDSKSAKDLKDAKDPKKVVIKNDDKREPKKGPPEPKKSLPGRK